MRDLLPDPWIPATEQFHEDDEVSLFNQAGVRYVVGERHSDKWMWMEDLPEHLENKC